MLTLNFSPFPTFQTERLQLRKINIEDAEQVFMLRSDERVNQFIDRPRANSIDDAKNFINQIRSRGSNSELLYWAIAQKKDSKLIGTIMFWNVSEENDQAEVGFELLPDFQGQGLMREALSQVLDYGFSSVGFRLVEAMPEKENQRSIALLERAGFKRDPNYSHTHTHHNQDFTTVRYTLAAGGS